MIDLRSSLQEAQRNISRWKNTYDYDVYPHKIVLNMMYRAYSTRLVYQAFDNDEMPEFDDFQEAVKYVIRFYGETAATEVHPYLEYWMSNHPTEEVGTISTARYEALATKAETNKNFLEELEFSYIFELLNDMCVLYYIAFRLSGESQVDAIYMDYTVTKQVFQQLLVARFMQMNYRPFQ